MEQVSREAEAATGVAAVVGLTEVIQEAAEDWQAVRAAVVAVAAVAAVTAVAAVAGSLVVNFGVQRAGTA